MLRSLALSLLLNLVSTTPGSPCLASHFEKASTSELAVYSQEGSGTLLGHGPAGQPPSREESKSPLYSQRFVFDQKRN